MPRAVTRLFAVLTKFRCSALEKRIKERLQPAFDAARQPNRPSRLAFLFRRTTQESVFILLLPVYLFFGGVAGWILPEVGWSTSATACYLGLLFTSYLLYQPALVRKSFNHYLIRDDIPKLPQLGAPNTSRSRQDPFPNHTQEFLEQWSLLLWAPVDSATLHRWILRRALWVHLCPPFMLAASYFFLTLFDYHEREVISRGAVFAAFEVAAPLGLAAFGVSHSLAFYHFRGATTLARLLSLTLLAAPFLSLSSHYSFVRSAFEPDHFWLTGWHPGGWIAGLWLALLHPAAGWVQWWPLIPLLAAFSTWPAATARFLRHLPSLGPSEMDQGTGTSLGPEPIDTSVSALSLLRSETARRHERFALQFSDPLARLLLKTLEPREKLLLQEFGYEHYPFLRRLSQSAILGATGATLIHLSFFLFIPHAIESAGATFLWYSLLTLNGFCATLFLARRAAARQAQLASLIAALGAPVDLLELVHLQSKLTRFSLLLLLIPAFWICVSFAPLPPELHWRPLLWGAARLYAFLWLIIPALWALYFLCFGQQRSRQDWRRLKLIIPLLLLAPAFAAVDPDQTLPTWAILLSFLWAAFAVKPIVRLCHWWWCQRRFDVAH